LIGLNINNYQIDNQKKSPLLIIKNTDLMMVTYKESLNFVFD